MSDEMKSYVGTAIIGAAGAAATLTIEHVVIPGAKKLVNVVKDKMNKKDEPEVEETTEK